IAELLEKSALRLAISPELAHAYERKYQTKMWLMPPVVPHRFIPPYANYGRGADPVIVGNIWGRRWVELLRRTVSGSGVKLRWFNNGEFPWLPCSVKDLESDGIFPQQQSAPDQALISILRDASFVVLPSGTLDDSDDRRAIARLSFPSRIPYILASSHAPILVLGHPDTAAARFVTREGIGMVAPYETSGFLEAVRRISAPEMNRRYREAAFGIAKRYTDLGAAEWIWNSLASGRPADGRYF
ncbi:MAG: hypothetical protein LAO79_17130, partial [Acidobacteriia bacterium]|nr:hypothetical protein [Terriglobia bacterium]